ncbi:MAG TPA: fluoride efflux transporter CrcB [Terriglobales bacterium]|nr:fluoride efflux transporter CrcB [Terriglobales bacterium]
MAIGILYLSIGAIFGAILRFLITHYSSELSHHHGFPYGTLLVNVLGSLLVGYILTWSADHEHDYWRLFAATGFCGAFTTFSAFAYESVAYWHEGRIGAFLINLLLNNFLCVLAVALGIRLHNATSV